jgi:hypothetical protein
VVNGRNWDEPACLPLFKAAESMGAVLFFHPQPRDNLVLVRTDKYGISNSIGVTVEDALLVATLIYGGIFDACPDLKVCVAHGGGPACFGMGRLDRGWQVRSEARLHLHKPPSRYQSCLYYDCVVDSEPALRYSLDHVGSDRVVLGSDWPFVQWEDSPAGWVKSLESLSQEEKDRILWQNLEMLLGIQPVTYALGCRTTERVCHISLFRYASRLPGHHLPLPAFVGVDVGKADAKVDGVAIGCDANAGRTRQDNGMAQILRHHVGRHDCRIHRRTGLHRPDQALLGVQPRRRVGVNEVIGQQGVQHGDIFFRHGFHALPVEIDDLLPIVCHLFVSYVE